MNYDPLDDAITIEPDVWFGQVNIEGFLGFFIKGQGAVPYDENVHSDIDKKPYTIIHFEFIPIDVTRKTFSRRIGKWTEEFTEVLWSSLETLTDQVASIKGLVLGQFNILREASGMYVKCLRVPNPDNEEGETWTTMKFEEIYHDAIACADAWEAHTGKEIGGSPVADLPFMPDESDPLIITEVLMDQFSSVKPSDESDPPRPDPQRASMAAFLPALWQQAGEDMVEMQRLLIAYPMMTQHFTIESPEVVEVCGGDE